MNLEADRYARLKEGVLEHAADEVREQSCDGKFLVIFEPGDATHYELFGVQVRGSHWYVGSNVTGCGEFPLGEWLHWSYFMEKTDTINEHSARLLSDILNLAFMPEFEPED